MYRKAIYSLKKKLNSRNVLLMRFKKIINKLNPDNTKCPKWGHKTSFAFKRCLKNVLSLNFGLCIVWEVSINIYKHIWYTFWLQFNKNYCLSLTKSLSQQYLKIMSTFVFQLTFYGSSAILLQIPLICQQIIQSIKSNCHVYVSFLMCIIKSIFDRWIHNSTAEKKNGYQNREIHLERKRGSWYLKITDDVVFSNYATRWTFRRSTFSF